MNTTTIVLADDHHVVRRGIQALLEAENDFTIVGQASDGLEAAEMVERLQPDILVLDLMMPGLNGFEVARRTARTSPKTRVVILSMYDDESYVIEALQAGAKGYVLKRSTLEELVMAIREVTSGRYYLNPAPPDMDIETYVGIAEGTAPDLYSTLTPREREALQLAAEGCDRVRIAERLSISPRTAEAHRANAMRKLGLRSQSELIRYAVRRGLLPLE